MVERGETSGRSMRRVCKHRVGGIGGGGASREAAQGTYLDRIIPIHGRDYDPISFSR